MEEYISVNQYLCLLVLIFKNKGDVQSCSNYREIKPNDENLGKTCGSEAK